jgi:FkbM family methyltransferase
MNISWKYRVGLLTSSCQKLLFSQQWFPLVSWIPQGLDWIYDAQRYAGTRKLGIIFDAGANVGQTAKDLILYFPNSKIECFEPVASTYNVLNAKFKSNPNIRCWQVALGAINENIQINIYHDSELNTLVSGISGRELMGTVQQFVKAVTIDNFCMQQKSEA